MADWTSIELADPISVEAQTGGVAAPALRIAVLNATIVVESDEIPLIILMCPGAYVVPPFCVTDRIVLANVGPYARFATCSAGWGRSEGESRLSDLVGLLCF
jgi:hypothetical protein